MTLKPHKILRLQLMTYMACKVSMPGTLGRGTLVALVKAHLSFKAMCLKRLLFDSTT